MLANYPDSFMSPMSTQHTLVEYSSLVCQDSFGCEQQVQVSNTMLKRKYKEPFNKGQKGQKMCV